MRSPHTWETDAHIGRLAHAAQRRCGGLQKQTQRAFPPFLANTAAVAATLGADAHGAVEAAQYSRPDAEAKLAGRAEIDRIEAPAIQRGNPSGGGRAPEQ